MKKDFICVSCWTSFQVDASTLAQSTMVACPSCGAQQPSGTNAPGPMGTEADAEEVDEGGATLEMKLPPSLLAEIGSGQFGDTGGLVLPESAGAAAPNNAPSWGSPAPAAAGSGWAIPGAAPPSAPSPPQPTPAPPPQPAPAPPSQPAPPAEAPATDKPAAEAVWRMRLPSGLVLTFPSIDMVRAWAAEKPADRMQIAYGDSEFQSFQEYLEVSREIQDPVEALRAVGKPRPKTNPGSAIPAFAPSTEAPAAAAHAPEDPAAAAAAARGQGPRPKPMHTQFQFRTEEPSSPWPRRIALIAVTVLLLGGGVVGVLLWQGIIG